MGRGSPVDPVLEIGTIVCNSCCSLYLLRKAAVMRTNVKQSRISVSELLLGKPQNTLVDC